MPHWTAQQHFDYMNAAGVGFSPRYGDGSAGHPWREADGSTPERNPVEEHLAVTRYLQGLASGYATMLERIVADLPAMTDTCRIAVLLPCRNEAQHIAGMLDLLAEQYRLDGRPLDRDAFEVLVLSNHVPCEPTDDTVERARAWSHPLGMTVHVIDYIHPSDEPCPLTMARKILADLALVRAVRRGVAERSLYLACEDADALWIAPHQLASMIDVLDRDPGLDGVRGQQDRCPWIMVRHPLLLLMRRSWNFTEAHMARRSLRPEHNPSFDFNWNRIVASGWNTAFSAEVYARIGGYTRERRFEEDMDIGEKISCLRAYRSRGGMMPQVNTFGRLACRAEGSPRRWFYRFATGIEPYLDTDGYANFFGLEHERAVKFQTLEEFEEALAPFTALQPENVSTLQGMLQKDLAFLVAARKDVATGQSEYALVMRALGFAADAFRIEGGRLELLDLKGPRARIEQLMARLPAEPVPARLVAGARYRRTWHGFRGQKPRPYRVGLIGCGRVVEEGHVSAYLRLPANVTLAALCDPSPGRRQVVGDRLGVRPARRFGDLEAMLSDATLDAAVVSSPSADHAGSVRRCLEHGVAVLCEKPLATSLVEARGLSAMARSYGLQFGTLHNYLTTDVWRRGIEILRSGELGKPLLLRTRIVAPEALPGFSDSERMWRHRRASAGRGCLLDQGYHLFYLSAAVYETAVDEVEAAVSYSGLPGRDVEDGAEVTLRHACGGQTTFSIDWASQTLEPTIYEIECSDGRLRLAEDTGEIEVTRGVDQIWRESIEPTDTGGYSGSLVESLRRMALGGEPVTPAERGVEVLTWIDKAYRVAAERE